MSIVIAGSLATDKVMKFNGLFQENFVASKLDAISVSFLVDSLEESYGGTAGNIAFNLGMLGITTKLFAAAGNDFVQYAAWLEKHGVDVSTVQIDPELRTAFFNVLTDNANNQIGSFYPGAMSNQYTVDPKDLKGVTLALIAATNPDDMRTLPGVFRDANIPFIFDPSQQIPMLSKEDLINGFTGSYAICCNDYELSMIKQRTNLTDLDILDLTTNLVITQGEEGSMIKTKEGDIHAKALPAREVVDPTGAGDAYRAGLIYGFVNEWDLKETAQFASAVAVHAVEYRGPQEHSFTIEDVMKRVEANSA